jgi:hypothetical protein
LTKSDGASLLARLPQVRPAQIQTLRCSGSGFPVSCLLWVHSRTALDDSIQAERGAVILVQVSGTRGRRGSCVSTPTILRASRKRSVPYPPRCTSSEQLLRVVEYLALKLLISKVDIRSGLRKSMKF